MTGFRALSDQTLAEILAALRRDVLDQPDPGRVVQDLQVHQIELERQNRELREAQQALEESRNRYADLYDFAPVGYATLNRLGQITEMNLTAARLLSVERGPARGLFLGTRLVPGGERALLTTLARVLDTGEETSLEVGLGATAGALTGSTVVPQASPEAPRQLRLVIHREPQHPGVKDPPACRVALLDVTEHLRLTQQLRERERQFAQLAHYDALTGLPNRLLFADRLTQAIRQAHRERHQVALLFLDLDGFKGINDSLGHAGGDRVLQQAAERMCGLVRGSDTVARLGGDEFICILGALEHDSAAGEVAHKLVEAFKQPFEVNAKLLYVTTSIGISLYPQDGADVETLVRNADTAMYLAKDQGRDTFRLYSADMPIRLTHLDTTRRSQPRPTPARALDHITQYPTP